MKRFISILLLTSLLVGGSWLRADVRMPLIFGNHMVLQQDGKLSIWGWAESGEKVKVSFLGQEATAVAGADGKWMVNLKPVKRQKESATLTLTTK